jgi:hypothetical protein
MSSWTIQINQPTTLADSVENDPSAPLALHCGNGFDGGFSLY